MGNIIPCFGGRGSIDGQRPRKPLPQAVLERAGSLNACGEQISVGRVKRLVQNKNPCFGFLAPEEGGPDIYFNEDLLGDGKSWKQFADIVQQFGPSMAPVLYVTECSQGRPRAKGVVALDDEQLKELDEDHDGLISLFELASFVGAHPELKDASLTKRETQYLRSQERHEQQAEQNKAEAREREELFQCHDAAEERLYKRRDEENGKAKQLFEEGERLWNAGKKDQAKKVQIEAKRHQQQSRYYRQQAIDLDWKNNEDMFEFVQVHEHKGRKRDGTWIDLHGLSADFAEHKTADFLEQARSCKQCEIEVITGAGNHSGKGGPVVKKRILALLGHMRLSFTEETAGSVVVKLA